jgi:RNA polymerase sigma-70 factor (ECF subfamily)
VQKGKFQRLIGQNSITGQGQPEAMPTFGACSSAVGYPQLYRMFMQRWPNPSLAEELVQRTVFDAVRGRSRYDPSKGSPEKWIFGIARNNIRLEMRRRASCPSVDGNINTYLEAMGSEPLPDEVLEQKETAAIVRTALSKLESKEQAVLKAKYIEGLSARDIARRIRLYNNERSRIDAMSA